MCVCFIATSPRQVEAARETHRQAGAIAVECRCVCNNYDISGFWRSWHASFNKWLIRYMYIPLGGQKWRLLNVWPIFTFVALWHDLEWHLLRWAWLMALFIAPEMLCKAIIRRPQWAVHWNKAWFLHLCAACSAFYIAVRCPRSACISCVCEACWCSQPVLFPVIHNVHHYTGHDGGQPCRLRIWATGRG